MHIIKDCTPQGLLYYNLQMLCIVTTTVESFTQDVIDNTEGVPQVPIMTDSRSKLSYLCMTTSLILFYPLIYDLDMGVLLLQF